MAQTKKQTQEIKRVVSLLKKAAEIADRLELTVGNGGEVGGIVGSLADELELRLA